MYGFEEKKNIYYKMFSPFSFFFILYLLFVCVTEIIVVEISEFFFIYKHVFEEL